MRDGLLVVGACALLSFGCKRSQVETASDAAPATSAAATAAPEVAKGLLGSWSWVDAANQTDTLQISNKELVETLTGESLPEAGVVRRSPIAKAVPSLQAASGVLVLGPLTDRMKPYEAVQWWELGDASVKWYRSGEQYDTADEAGASKGEAEHARTYTRKP